MDFIEVQLWTLLLPTPRPICLPLPSRDTLTFPFHLGEASGIKR